MCRWNLRPAEFLRSYRRWEGMLANCRRRSCRASHPRSRLENLIRVVDPLFARYEYEHLVVLHSVHEDDGKNL